MTKEQSDVRVADFNDLLNDAIGANTSSERIAARKALVEAYRNAIAPSASIADTAGAKPEPLVTLSGAQLLEAFNYVAPDHPNDPDQLECDVTIAYGEGHSGKGHYCWITDYPDEGAILLDGKQAEGIATPPAPSVADEVLPGEYDNAEDCIKALRAGAPSVADAAGASDARDAARYRWLRGQEHSLETQQRDKGIVNGPSCYHDVEGIRELKWGDDLDASIDAAIAKGVRQ